MTVPAFANPSATAATTDAVAATAADSVAAAAAGAATDSSHSEPSRSISPQQRVEVLPHRSLTVAALVWTLSIALIS